MPTRKLITVTAIVACAIYLVGAPLTYGYAVNRLYHQLPEKEAYNTAVVASIFWPVYWPFKAAELFFKR